jgi:hypothetical protein
VVAGQSVHQQVADCGAHLSCPHLRGAQGGAGRGQRRGSETGVRGWSGAAICSAHFSQARQHISPKLVSTYLPSSSAHISQARQHISPKLVSKYLPSSSAHISQARQHISPKLVSYISVRRVLTRVDLKHFQTTPISVGYGASYIFMTDL